MLDHGQWNGPSAAEKVTENNTRLLNALRDAALTLRRTMKAVDRAK